MNWTIIIIETIILIIAFTAMILIPLVKNPVWWIADYPKERNRTYGFGCDLNTWEKQFESLRDDDNFRLVFFEYHAKPR